MSPKESKLQFKLWEKIIFFFPVQLLVVHFKKNLILLLYWIFLFAIVTKSIALKYGIPYLFLYPEYLGSVDFTSHFIIGLLSGAFIMAFNLSSYVVNGFRFTFLATLNRPFIKYCQNNFLLPLIFSAIYIVNLVLFQLEYEHVSPLQIFINVLGVLTGNLVFIAITAIYFISTNRNVIHYLPVDSNGDYVNPVKDLFSNKRKWEREQRYRKEWKVVSYISNYGKIALARDSSHYRKETLEKVFFQNRINASIFQVIILVTIFILGWYHENELLMIPAAGSILLFITMFMMLTSAFYSWFRGWTSIVLISLLFLANFLSTEKALMYENQAYGIDYDTAKVSYTQENILSLQENRQNLYLDVENGLTLLQNWKEQTGEDKPVAVFLNVPGGGLRSALWTIHSVSHANNLSDGKLWKNLVLISGSSGGMVGAAYLREYYYRTTYDSANVEIEEIREDISKDKLNPVAATAVLNDLLFRFKTFEYQGHEYVKDRALAFEQKLNSDTRGWLNRRVKDYAQLEIERKIPMLVLSPTISDDGRKLLISSQPISYLCYNTDSNQMNENIEFSRFFEEQGSENLTFISALRMSATFPYVFPAANLPTEPSIQILDAGIRDNYGMSNTLKYIYFFKDWLLKNTSKIVIIQVRDQPKFVDLEGKEQPSLLDEISQPFGTFYNTVLDVQDYQMDDQIRLAKDWYEGDIEVHDFVLDRSPSNPISLSWHLTNREKSRIESAIFTPHNQKTFSTIKKTLN